jgi:apolipoprotein N-acyltransferase
MGSLAAVPTRLAAALVAGVATYAGFDPIGYPLLIPAGLALFFGAVRGVSARRGAAIGAVFGATFFGLHIFWMRALGTEPWIALTFLETLFVILLGAVLAILSVRRGWPVWFAVAWSAVESMRGAMPFGGFTWGQLGFAVMDTPVEPLLPWAGVAGAGFVVALLGSLLAWALLEAAPRRAAIATVAVVAVLALAALAQPPGLRDSTATLTVAIVQGDVPGTGDNLVAHHREVTAGQATATRELAGQVERGEVPRPDLVIWPENSTAVDPFDDEEARDEIASAVRAIDVPVLVGAIVDDPDPGRVLNQGVLYDPVTGPGERYAKRHPVPFGEFVPFRWLFRERFTERIGLVRRDMAAGTRTSPLLVARREGGVVPFADAICFDIAFDDALGSQVRRGAQLGVVQTSNALFIHTSQIDQQFTISRVRARELGRSVVVSSVNGRSGVVGADGAVADELQVQSRAVAVERVPLHETRPPSLWTGRWWGPVALTSTLLGLLFTWPPYRRRNRRGNDSRPAGEPTRNATEPEGETMTQDAFGRVVMVIPTYNEALNLEWIVGRLRTAQPDVDVMIVDDNSPDGTGDIADRLAAADERVQVVHRTEKAGLGAAYVHGFKVALAQGYDVIGEMDADGSHQPEQLYRLLNGLVDADLVIGSRYVRGGSVVNWPLFRRLLSAFGNLYVRILLGIKVNDSTAGFRLFRRETLEKIDVTTVNTTGYVFQTDMAWRALQARLRVHEVPIEFIERERGDSKMSSSVAIESLQRITWWGLKERCNRLIRMVRGTRR